MTAREILNVLNDPNIKPIRTIGETWKGMYAGDVVFEMSNGWKVIVFNDCDDWDYLDSIILPNHRKYEFWDCVDCEDLGELRSWQPNNLEEWTKL